jgi:hypothetical protein
MLNGEDGDELDGPDAFRSLFVEGRIYVLTKGGRPSNADLLFERAARLQRSAESRR